MGFEKGNGHETKNITYRKKQKDHKGFRKTPGDGQALCDSKVRTVQNSAV